jgi:hypothetical protein
MMPPLTGPDLKVLYSFFFLTVFLFGIGGVVLGVTLLSSLLYLTFASMQRPEASLKDLIKSAQSHSFECVRTLTAANTGRTECQWHRCRSSECPSPDQQAYTPRCEQHSRAKPPLRCTSTVSERHCRDLPTVSAHIPHHHLRHGVQPR